jgi:hypothetical protein
MLNIGDLVNNIDTADYNYGMVIETHINIAEELHTAALLDVEDTGEDLRTEPPGARVLWECGDINVHYLDELEVIGETPKPVA